jgi:hypothetical protein
MVADPFNMLSWLAGQQQQGLKTSGSGGGGGGGITDTDVAAAIKAATAQIAGQGAGGQAQALVPMWGLTTPPAPTKSPSPMDSWGRNVPTGESPDLYTSDQAAAQWLDMSMDEKNKFKDEAVRSGILPPTADATDAYRAWVGAVGDAADYNSTKSAWSQFISPWQALQKLSLQRAADDGKAFDAFAPKTTTQTSVQKYSEDDVAGVARQVLQQELQRDPTDAEIAAYTIAVNRAAASNPTTTTSTVTPDENGNQSVETSTEGGIDPSQEIYDQIRNDPERAQVQAATRYYPAALQALESLVQL